MQYIKDASFLKYPKTYRRQSDLRNPTLLFLLIYIPPNLPVHPSLMSHHPTLRVNRTF
ncbi:hypothetical protein M422DRAFT_40016 [Sphaerobolus stellatus SS14]|uniref:Uncharacterized protein n=1 Tax=Sphaerobolus stellatus (strain SS14) TaxID=990650 RepID=A0A0C9UAP7_SPHS4|nr:hypothetical protein M422DRAFT_40016 [Sphaerobolus stellatus SS14]